MPTYRELEQQLAQLRTDNRRLRRQRQRAVVRLRSIYARLFQLDEALAAKGEPAPPEEPPYDA
jgi:septal ring factor EnvC (AmiA/AmiB activator)